MIFWVGVWTSEQKLCCSSVVGIMEIAPLVKLPNTYVYLFNHEYIGVLTLVWELQPQQVVILFRGVDIL